MPGPDHPSPRVYKLLKTHTLGTLNAEAGGGAAILARVGSPLTAEQLNDEELRRLFLVALARLCIEGNWEGLLIPT